jgi:hypothetical protein
MKLDGEEEEEEEEEEWKVLDKVPTTSHPITSRCHTVPLAVILKSSTHCKHRYLVP